MRALLVCALLGSGARTLPAQDADPVRFARLAALLDRLAVQDSFSGVVLISRGDRPVFARAYGEASKSFGVANRVDTKFFIASMTKMFTGVAVAQLAESGKLAFHDPVIRHLPDLRTPGASRITLHHLLTHTSGLGSIWKREYQEANHARFREVRDYFPLFERDAPAFAPGARWAYSNAGYVVLGAVIERVTGQRYRDYIRDRVFRRAGMAGCENSDEVDRPVPNRAVPYTRHNWTLPGRADHTSAEMIGLAAMMPAGGAACTAADLVRFARALLRHELLGRAYTDTATTGRVTYRSGASYAYGFANETVNGQRIIFHDGGADGISANLDIFPELDYVAVVLSNYDHPAARPAVREIRALLTLRR